MQRQRPAEPITVISDSPNIIAAANHCVEIVPPKARIRAWHHSPCAAVPMQRQGPPHKEALVEGRIGPHSPSVVAATAHPKKEVVH